jgi:endonuclease/exonuclease/phosphatase family metal-dependent hydrolase
VVALLLRRWAVSAVAFVALVALAAVVVPRAVGGPHPSGDPGGPGLVVMSMNMEYGGADAERILAVAREHRVDVLSLQELTPQAVARLDAAGAQEMFPAQILADENGAGGSGVMARRPMAFVENDPTGAEQPEVAMVVPGAGRIHVKVVHPWPPVSRGGARKWKYALGRIPGPDAEGVPRILAGDFNATLDHSAFREVLDLGYVDAADAAGAGLKATWPVGRRVPGIAIDHVLVPRSVGVEAFDVETIPGTDHRAVVARLRLPGRPAGAQAA